MLTVAMPLASVSTETWAKPVGEELKLAEGRAKLRLRFNVNLLQLREDMLSSLEALFWKISDCIVSILYFGHMLHFEDSLEEQ